MSSVAEYLRDLQVDAVPYTHERTYTSVAEARALGIDASEVAKTIVLDTAFGYALAVIPAPMRLDMHAVRDATNDPHTRLATETDIERDFSAYELGAIPPLGSLLKVPVFVDIALARHRDIVFAAGSQTDSIKMHTADLINDPAVTVARLCAE